MEKQTYKMRFICDSNQKCYTTATEIGNWLISKGLHLYQDDFGCYHFGSQINKILESANRQLSKIGLIEKCVTMQDYPKLVKQSSNQGKVNKSVFNYFKENDMNISVKVIGDTGARGIDLYTEDAIKILAKYLHIGYSLYNDVQDVKIFKEPFILLTSKRKQKQVNYTLKNNSEKLF